MRLFEYEYNAIVSEVPQKPVNRRVARIRNVIDLLAFKPERKLPPPREGQRYSRRARGEHTTSYFLYIKYGVCHRNESIKSAINSADGFN